MRIGVPKEIKPQEYRVGMTPASVREAVRHEHEVLVETGAGRGIGASDEAYERAGAKILDSAEEIFRQAQLIVKVKEPQPDECEWLQQGQVLFTFLHLAADPKQAELLKKSGVTAIAYETVTDARGGLPILTPMSEVAGRMAVQAGAWFLHKSHGGKGVLVAGVPGAPPARVTIIGGGVVGSNAARMALGLGADVTVLDKSLPRLQYLDELYGPRLKTRFATFDATEELVLHADLIIGAVLVPGAATPKLVTREHLSRMTDGAVLVDVSIDQGGVFETSQPTTHNNPVYVVDGIVHYCVTNMPGAVPRTSTYALNAATLPHILAIADKGWRRALREDAHLAHGLNVHEGRITHAAVAGSLGEQVLPASEILGAGVN